MPFIGCHSKNPKYRVGRNVNFSVIGGEKSYIFSFSLEKFMLIIPLHLPNGAEVIRLSYCCRLLLCVMYRPCCSIKKNSILFHYSARPNDYSNICTYCTVILILIDFPFLIKHIGFNTVVDKLGFLIISICSHIYSIPIDILFRPIINYKEQYIHALSLSNFNSRHTLLIHHGLLGVTKQSVTLFKVIF